MKKKRKVSAKEKEYLKTMTKPSTLFEGARECIGCTFRITQHTSTATFKLHLRDRQCDQVRVCQKCQIFRTLNADMLNQHAEHCVGVIVKEK